MTLMWEVRAADGRLDDLVAYANEHAHPGALVFRSDGSDPRVVVIDPSGRGVPDVPAELVARAPHEWSFEPVDRVAGPAQDDKSSRGE